MTNRKPIVINGTRFEQLQSGIGVDIGGYQMPAAAGTAGQRLVFPASGTELAWKSNHTVATWALRNAIAKTGANLVNGLVMPRAGVPIKAFAYCRTAPTGAALIFDILINGVSIWNNNAANRLSIAATATSGTQTTFDPAASAAEGAVLTISIIQIGSTIAGGDITVELLLN